MQLLIVHREREIGEGLRGLVGITPAGKVKFWEKPG
jgi:hypothetical protein